MMKKQEMENERKSTVLWHVGSKTFVADCCSTVY